MLAQSFERAAADPTAPEPPVDEAIRELLRLHAANQPEAASRLFEAVQRFTESPRGATAMGSDERSTMLRSLRELDALPDELPASARVAIARALELRDLTRAMVELGSLSPHDARISAWLLRAHAPTLAAALCDALDTRERWYESIDRHIHVFLGSRTAKVMLVVLFVALGVKLWRNARPAPAPARLEEEALIRDRTRFAADKARESGQRDVATIYEKLGESLTRQPPDCAGATSYLVLLHQYVERSPLDERRASGAVLSTVEEVATKRCAPK